MSRRPALFLLILIGLVPVVAASHAQEAFPAPVFVTTLQTPALPLLKPAQHEAAIAGARSEMFDVAAQLRKQHGDKTSNWPPAVWAEFYVAEDAHTRAVARRDFEAPETKLRLADTVEDFLRGASGNKAITLVTSAEEAALVVQITGRRYISAEGPTDNRYFIRFRVVPGAKMSSERFLELVNGHKWNNLWSKLISHPREGSMYADLEAGSMASWKNCAGTVRTILEIFIRTRMDPAKKK